LDRSLRGDGDGIAYGSTLQAPRRGLVDVLHQHIVTAFQQGEGLAFNGPGASIRKAANLVIISVMLRYIEAL
jgi:hypothetical protein